MSKDRIVYKQSYVSKSDKSARQIARHRLYYYATRPGVVCNRGCGFGLWGKLPGMKTIDIIQDLAPAVDVVSAAAEHHTLFYGTLSVDEKTAQQFGMYDRTAWERLLRTRMDVLRDAMHIRRENFHWTACMHYKKTHPHVHIIFWDAGPEPRQDYIKKERFEEMTAHIRTAFTCAIENQAEINAVQNQSREAARETRRALAAMFRDANLADALDLDRIRPEQQSELGRQLMELAATLPSRGRLNYQFLPPQYKEKLNKYLENVLKLREFSVLEEKYLNLKQEVSRLYGNTPNVAQEYQEKARRELQKELGNETLKFLKSVAVELKKQAPPDDIQTLLHATQHIAKQILEGSTEYHELLGALPNWRTPLPVLLEHEENRQKMDHLTQMLAQDIRIRNKTHGLICREQTSAQSREEAKQLRTDINKAVYRAMHETLWTAVQEDKGYIAQSKVSIAAAGLVQLFRVFSQEKNRMQNQSEMLRAKYRNLSKSAKMDLRKQREQEGSWSLGG